MSKQTPVTLPSGSYLIVDVPKLSNQIRQSFGYLQGDCPTLHYGWCRPLPSACCEIVGKGLCSEITEGEAATVVEGSTVSFGYVDYLNHARSTFYPDQSLHSLIKSLGHEPNSCVLIKCENPELLTQ